MLNPLFLIGFMGSGKTTLGRKLSAKWNYSFIDLDHFIEQRHFKTINQLFEIYGEQGFREIERTMLHEVSQMEQTVIATGGGTPCFFDNMQYMNHAGKTVFIDVPNDALLPRLERGKHRRPLLMNKTKDEIKIYIEEMMLKRLPFYKQSHITLDGTILISSSPHSDTYSQNVDLISKELEPLLR